MAANHRDVAGPVFERLLPGHRDQRNREDDFDDEAHVSLSENGGSKMEDGLPSENGAAGMRATWTVKPAEQW